MPLSPETLAEIAASPREQILRALNKLNQARRNPQFSEAYSDNSDAVELQSALTARLEAIDAQARIDAVDDVVTEALDIVEEAN